MKVCDSKELLDLINKLTICGFRGSSQEVVNSDLKIYVRKNIVCKHEECGTDKERCHECTRNSNYEDLYIGQ